MPPYLTNRVKAKAVLQGKLDAMVGHLQKLQPTRQLNIRPETGGGAIPGGWKWKKCYRKSHVWRDFRENLNDREGQSMSTPVDKYPFTWTTQGVRCYP